MPKVQRDDALLRNIEAIAQDCGGYSQAAKRLGVDRVVLWRFCATGCAIERNRVRLAEAAKRYANESSSTNIDEKLLHFANRSNVTTDDLQVIRHFCQKMISLVDAYEKMNEGSR